MQSFKVFSTGHNSLFFQALEITSMRVNLSHYLLSLSIAAGSLISADVAKADALEIAQFPLFQSVNFPPMNMLVMGRDHSLFYEAYNDASDLTGNGAPDVGYKPLEIDYYGLFDSFKCYSYGTGDGIFVPTGPSGTNKTCGGGWSGDFLNWVTTSRMLIHGAKSIRASRVTGTTLAITHHYRYHQREITICLQTPHLQVLQTDLGCEYLVTLSFEFGSGSLLSGRSLAIDAWTAEAVPIAPAMGLAEMILQFVSKSAISLLSRWAPTVSGTQVVNLNQPDCSMNLERRVGCTLV